MCWIWRFQIKNIIKKQKEVVTLFIKVSTEHSIRILIFLAGEKGNLFSAQVLSEKLEIPLPFFMKIVSQLKKGKLIKAVQGRSGGFLLGKSPEKITLYEILRVTENERILAPCLENNSRRLKDGKALKNCFEEMQKEMDVRLKMTTIQTLLDAEGPEAKAETKPVAKPAAKPVAKSTAKPAAKASVKSAPKAAVKPAAKTAAKPAVVKTTAKPAKKSAVKPAKTGSKTISRKKPKKA